MKRRNRRILAVLRRLFPLFLLGLIALIVYATGLDTYLSYQKLREVHDKLQLLAQLHPIASPLFLIAIYALVTALSMPVSIFLSYLAGFLFPQPLCTLYVVIGATAGALLLFLAARSAFQGQLKKRAGGRLKAFRRGFEEDQVSYLLFLRLVPFFPFWLVNLAPAFFPIRPWTYTWTTLVGLVPGSFVLTQIGRGLDAIFDKYTSFSWQAFFNTQMMIALIALGLLSLLPIIIKKWRKKRS